MGFTSNLRYSRHLPFPRAFDNLYFPINFSYVCFPVKHDNSSANEKRSPETVFARDPCHYLCHQNIRLSHSLPLNTCLQNHTPTQDRPSDREERFLFMPPFVSLLTNTKYAVIMPWLYLSSLLSPVSARSYIHPHIQLHRSSPLITAEN